jgi:hypothetical protein
VGGERYSAECPPLHESAPDTGLGIVVLEQSLGNAGLGELGGSFVFVQAAMELELISRRNLVWCQALNRDHLGFLPKAG